MPPDYSNWGPHILRFYVRRYLRKAYGVHSIECRRIERLKASLAAMLMRIALLFSLSWVMRLTAPLFAVVGQEISGRDLILILGGLFLLAEAWLCLRGEEGLGLGDAKLLGMFGAFLGWQGAVATLVLGSIAGATVGLGMLLFGRAEAKTRLPFGLFLSAGALLTLFWGPFRLLQALFSPP